MNQKNKKGHTDATHQNNHFEFSTRKPKSQVGRLLYRNMFYIPAVLLLIVAICYLSNIEFKSEADAKTRDLGRPLIYGQALDASEPAELSVQELIIRSCADHDVDSDLALAVAKLETGNFTSNAYVNHNNVGGLTVDGEVLSYSSLENGVNAFVRTLDNLDTTDLDKLASMYCPPNKVEWAAEVKKIMEER